MRPNADDIRLARWLCVCVLRAAALVLLLVAAAGVAVGWAAYSRESLRASAGLAPATSLWQWFQTQWTLVLTAAGLLLASRFLLRFLVPATPTGCPSCGYDMTGLSGKPCPECGKA